jgi:hypothetical protein
MADAESEYSDDVPENTFLQEVEWAVDAAALNGVDLEHLRLSFAGPGYDLLQNTDGSWTVYAHANSPFARFENAKLETFDVRRRILRLDPIPDYIILETAIAGNLSAGRRAAALARIERVASDAFPDASVEVTAFDGDVDVTITYLGG